MPTLPARAAAYTRTGILRRFLDQLSTAPPARVDNAYAEQRLGLKGGDVRAFLQSLRVLGFIDPYGALTDRARRTRAQTQRGPAVREGLAQAYPELARQWEARGAMSRAEIEDFFKVEYGLSASSAAPAAKLFLDLMREFGPAAEGLGVRGWGLGAGGSEMESGAEASGNSGLAPASSPAPRPQTSDPAPAPSPQTPDPLAFRLAALEAIKSSLKIDINEQWDEERINLVFDRMERLVGMITAGEKADAS
jgi:hypothetical protein